MEQVRIAVAIIVAIGLGPPSDTHPKLIRHLLCCGHGERGSVWSGGHTYGYGGRCNTDVSNPTATQLLGGCHQLRGGCHQLLGGCHQLAVMLNQ